MKVHKKYSILFIVFILTAFSFMSCKSTYYKMKSNYHLKKANAKYMEENFKAAVKEYIEAMKADPNNRVIYYYIASCYQNMFKPGLPLDEDLLNKTGEILEKIKDVEKLKEIVYHINLINDYEEIKQYIESLTTETEMETDEAKGTETEESLEKKEGEEEEVAEAKEKTTAENITPEETPQEKEEAEKAIDKVEEIIKKWEEEKKLAEEKKKLEAERKRKAQMALVVSSDQEKLKKKEEAEKTPEAPKWDISKMSETQKIMFINNTLRAIKALSNFILVKHFETATYDAILALADIYDKLRNFKLAEKYYLKILEIQPNNSRAYYVIANFYDSYGKDEKAIEYFNKAISLNPDDPVGYLYLGNYYLGKLQFDKAIASVEKMIELINNNPEYDARKKAEAYYTLGVFCWSKSFRKKNLLPKEREAVIKKGMEALKKAMELDPKYPEPYAYYNLLLREMIKVYPKKRRELLKEADTYREKFTELYKRLKARKELEKKLKEEIQ